MRGVRANSSAEVPDSGVYVFLLRLSDVRVWLGMMLGMVLVVLCRLTLAIAGELWAMSREDGAPRAGDSSVSGVSSVGPDSFGVADNLLKGEVEGEFAAGDVDGTLM